jgi:hypothetical protein
VAIDYDAQLLEAVAVRRRRLRNALLLGRGRARRSIQDNLVGVMVGCILAAVVCAGCVGWSFVRDALAAQAAKTAATTPTTSGTPR